MDYTKYVIRSSIGRKRNDGNKISTVYTLGIKLITMSLKKTSRKPHMYPP